MNTKDLTDEQIDATFNNMQDGGIGFLKTWGYRQFARSIVEALEAQRQAGQEPVMFAFLHSDGTWNDASHTEHSVGMQPLFATPQPAAQIAPEGYKLVPLVPTPEMLRAASIAPIPAVMLDSFSARENLSNATHYKAMLAAAPHHP